MEQKRSKADKFTDTICTLNTCTRAETLLCYDSAHGLPMILYGSGTQTRSQGLADHKPQRKSEHRLHEMRE